MNIQEYIQNGIVESYVLGITDAKETSEIETLRLQYPELEEAINNFSLILQEEAFKNAVAPPAFIKDKVMASIKEQTSQTLTYVPPVNSVERKETPIVPVHRWRFTAAASVILLIGSAILNVYFYNKYSRKNSDYETLLAERSILQASNQIYQTKLNIWDSTMNLIANPAMVKVTMKDPAEKQDNLATVLWNKQSKEVFLIQNKLPDPAAGKQYQLWALVDGKPVDAGVLTTNCVGACKMKTILKAQAFAITLEKAGGSPTPDLGSLYVLGKVS